MHSRTLLPRAFTLIELLVVIAIIAILMGLLFPAVNGALNAARKASAKNDVVQIANAVVMYETEYGKLPPNSSTVSGTLVETLIASNTAAGISNNPRRIVFIEAPNFRTNRGGLDGNTYRDPWGGPYQIAMDTAYSNQVAVGGANGPAATTIRKRVGVWNTNANARMRVASWE